MTRPLPDPIRRVQAQVEEMGLSWRTQHGGRHIKIYVEDRMVGVLSMNPHRCAGPRPYNNLVANIRRAARNIKMEIEREGDTDRDGQAPHPRGGLPGNPGARL